MINFGLKKLINKHAITIGLIVFSFLLFSKETRGQQSELNDELYTNLQSADTLIRIEALHQLGEYYRQRDPDSLHYFASEAKNLLSAYKTTEQALDYQKYREEKSKNHKHLGSVCLSRQDFDQAQYHYSESYLIDSLLEQPSNMAYSLNSLSLVFSNKQDYAKAIKYLLSAISILETLNKDVEISFCEFNLGMLYVRMANFKKSKIYLNRSLNKFLELNDSTNTAYLYDALTNISLQLHEVDSAVYYLSNSKIYKNGKIENDVLHTYFLGQIEVFKENFEQGIQYLNKAMSLAASQKSKQNYDYSKYLIAETYLKLEKPKRALDYLLKNDSVFGPTTFESPSRIRDSLLYATYNALGESKKAKHHFQRFQKALTPNKIHSANDVANAFEKEKTNKTIAIQKSLLETYILKNKLFSAIMVVGLILFTFFFGRLYLKKQLLKKEKAFVEAQYHSLSKTNIALNEKLLKISEKINANRNGKNQEKYKRSSLSEDQRKTYMSTILNHMDSAKPYLNPKLTQKDLSDELGISKHHLSEVLNINLGKNFYSFINLYRVEEAKRIIVKDTKNLTMLAIAFDSGFNSKASFNRVFKEVAGVTPSAFKDKHQFQIKTE